MDAKRALVVCAAVLVAAAQVAAAAEAGIHLTTGVISTCRCVVLDETGEGGGPSLSPSRLFSRPHTHSSGRPALRSVLRARAPRPGARVRLLALVPAQALSRPSERRDCRIDKLTPSPSLSPSPPRTPTTPSHSDAPARRASARRRLSAIAAEGTDPAGFSDARWGPHLGRQQYILALANGEKKKREKNAPCSPSLPLPFQPPSASWPAPERAPRPPLARQARISGAAKALSPRAPGGKGLARAGEAKGERGSAAAPHAAGLAVGGAGARTNAAGAAVISITLTTPPPL
jgi:hypothetical protein